MFNVSRAWLRARAGKLDWVVAFGDAESSLAVSLAAASLGLPICHVEAGFRAPINSGPEAIIARSIDCVANLRLATSRHAFDNLAAEGLKPSHFVGDLYLDLVSAWRSRAEILGDGEATDGRKSAVLLTVHHSRTSGGYPALIAAIERAVFERGKRCITVMHPKFASILHEPGPWVERRPPVDHDTLLELVDASDFVVTDSGGLQREAYFLGRRCLLVQDEAWWPELTDLQANYCIGASLERLGEGLGWVESQSPLVPDTSLFGDGLASSAVLRALLGEV
jgi:UDP-GlcNAc3NAcA epimerase